MYVVGVTSAAFLARRAVSHVAANAPLDFGT
jgi:hypothetical protein